MPATTVVPGTHLVAVGLRDGIGLAGQVRLVDLQAGRWTASCRRPAPDRRCAARSGRPAPRRPSGSRSTSPSRTTRVVGELSSASRSSFRLARYSCTMPIAELTTSTTPNSPSASDPVLRISTNSAPRIALNRVKTLVLKITHSDRDDAWLVALTCPRATRSATSAAVRPGVRSARDARWIRARCSPAYCDRWHPHDDGERRSGHRESARITLIGPSPCSVDWRR